MPGGICFSTVCDMPLTCASAALMFHGRLKEDLDDAVIGDRLGFNVFDVVDRVGQRALIERDHAAGHVVGGQTGVGENHADDGDV